MAHDFSDTIDNPEYLKLLKELRKDKISIDWESIVQAEREKFKDGKCPQCQIPLVREVSGLFRGQFHYTNPKCTRCGEHFSPLFWSRDMINRIPKKGTEEFLKLLHTPYDL